MNGWLVIFIIFAAMVGTLFIIGYLNLDQHPHIHVYDWTYRDDKGNEFVVTSASVSDNFDLLVRDHGLTGGYIITHVFLADYKKVF